MIQKMLVAFLMIGLTFAGQGGKGGKGGKGKGGHGNHGSHGGPGGPMQKPGGPGSHMQKPGGNEKPNMMMEMMGHMDGLCMDPEMIIKMCVMGTPLGTIGLFVLFVQYSVWTRSKDV